MPRPIRSLAPLVLLAACGESPPAIVDHADGTYSHAAPPGVDRNTTRREGALTWSYVGQARHSFTPEPLRELSYVVEAPRVRAEHEPYLELMRDDASGSLWKVSAVDLGLARAAVARRDAVSAEVALGLTVTGIERPALTPDEPVGARRTVKTSSWSGSSCDNQYYMGDDDRVRIDATGSPRRKAMVDVRVDGGTECSGVILRSDWVLTAAHCIFDDDENLIDRDRMSVFRWDGVDSTPGYGIAGRAWNSAFTGNFDPKDDWALLRLDTPLSGPFHDMDISSASDATLGDLDKVANYAFPAYAPGCASNVNGDIVEDLWMNNVGELGAIHNRKINFKIDGGPGHSGSPVFYCPDGDPDECEDDEQAFVIAVWSGWNGFETTMVGAKGASFRDLATTAMDD